MGTPTSLLWRDLTLGAGTPYRVEGVEGWEELPPGRYDKQNRSRAHGSFPSPVWSDERTVTATGFCWSAADRDALLAGFRRRMTFDGGEEPLAVTMAGRTLYAQAQIVRAAPRVIKGHWGVGRFGWIVVWRCTDPLRYGPAVTVSAGGLPTDGTGLDYGTEATGLAYPRDYGDPGQGGRVIVSNVDGTADAPVPYRVTGPLLEGWEVTVVETGERNRWTDALQAGQWVDVDTGQGTVLLNGTADRRKAMVVADWFIVPPGETRTLALSSLGGSDPAADLAATTAPANW